MNFEIMSSFISIKLDVTPSNYQLIVIQFLKAKQNIRIHIDTKYKLYRFLFPTEICLI